MYQLTTDKSSQDTGIIRLSNICITNMQRWQ